MDAGTVGKGRRELDGVHGVVVVDRIARRAYDLHELHAAVLEDPEVDHQRGSLVLARPADLVPDTRKAPVGLDLPPQTVQVVVEFRVSRVQRNGLAFDPAPTASVAHCRPRRHDPGPSECRQAAPPGRQAVRRQLAAAWRGSPLAPARVAPGARPRSAARGRRRQASRAAGSTAFSGAAGISGTGKAGCSSAGGGGTTGAGGGGSDAAGRLATTGGVSTGRAAGAGTGGAGGAGAGRTGGAGRGAGGAGLAGTAGARDLAKGFPAGAGSGDAGNSTIIGSPRLTVYCAAGSPA